MILSRLPDGTTLFEERLDQFRTDWRAAPETRRLVLDDGRPAVRLENGSLVTVLAPYWTVMRQYMHARLAPGVRHPPRARYCQACGAIMQISREFEHAWTFACDTCKSTEIHGKTIVGGTEGAGEREKT